MFHDEVLVVPVTILAVFGSGSWRGLRITGIGLRGLGHQICEGDLGVPRVSVGPVFGSRKEFLVLREVDLVGSTPKGLVVP